MGHIGAPQRFGMRDEEDLLQRKFDTVLGTDRTIIERLQTPCYLTAVRSHGSKELLSRRLGIGSLASADAGRLRLRHFKRV